MRIDGENEKLDEIWEAGLYLERLRIEGERFLGSCWGEKKINR